MEELIRLWRSKVLEPLVEEQAKEREAREKRMLKPGRKSWVPGADEVATLANGIAEEETLEVDVDDDEDGVKFKKGDAVSIDLIGRDEKDEEGVEKVEMLLSQNEKRDGIDYAYLGGIINREIKSALSKVQNQNGCTFPDLVKAMTIWSKAEKGGK